MMKRWKCSVCGYIHEGEEPPDFCPICDARKEEFELIEEVPVEVKGSGVQRIVIIGNGAAGMEAARAARRQLDDAEIHVFSREPYSFYSRLFLTPYLAGEKTQAELFVFNQNWYETNGIIQHLGEEVQEILPMERKILTSADVCDYDKLILCTGATPFNPYGPGIKKAGVFTLRNLRDANEILTYANSTKKAIVIGGGILGLEAAGALAKRGIQVEVLELARSLMPRQLDLPGARLLTQVLSDMGIGVHTGAEVVEILGKDRVSGVKLKDGNRIEAQMVVLSIGIIPEVTLAEEAGLQVNRGVVVDDFLRTSDPHIFAAGDVAEHNNRIYGLWYAAAEQGKLAGQNAAGAEIRYKGTVPVSILKVIGIELTSLGRIDKKHPDEEEIVHFLPEQREYKKLVLRNNEIIGAIIFHNNRLGGAVEAIIKRKKKLPPEIRSSIDNGTWEVLIDFSRNR